MYMKIKIENNKVAKKSEQKRNTMHFRMKSNTRRDRKGKSKGHAVESTGIYERSRRMSPCVKLHDYQAVDGVTDVATLSDKPNVSQFLLAIFAA